MMKPTASAASLKKRGRPASAQTAGLRLPGQPPLLPRWSAPRLRFELALKSVNDRVLASALLLVSAPVMLLSMALVKLTSRGPALYSQRRVGQFGRVFTIWKIRTMYHNCEKLTGPRWSTPGDPRVTRVGNALRALHIDELPQLVNVLRGQMSLIGPRPERPEIAAKLAGLVDDYDSRHAVLPGISGNAQIHLPPDTNVNDVRDKLVLDREYIQRFSAWFDLKMLALTGLKMVGVYRH
jgi:lipopolysaccharide/colanic/teichoic acid biosynthesis glycosyltransferase